MQQRDQVSSDDDNDERHFPLQNAETDISVVVSCSYIVKPVMMTMMTNEIVVGSTFVFVNVLDTVLSPFKHRYTRTHARTHRRTNALITSPSSSARRISMHSVMRCKSSPLDTGLVTSRITWIDDTEALSRTAT